ncbi:MAG: hypothetical protein IPP05_08320 [Cytophagaceae bacterium]|nr:hypothetical protein [Cytophagaceae bacterium]
MNLKIGSIQNMYKSLIFIFVSITSCYGQTQDSSAHSLLDAYDLMHKILKKQTSDTSSAEVFKQSLTMVPGFGYSQLKGLALVLEGNFSFKASEDAKVSVIVFVPEITFKKYFVPRVTSSIWLNHNQININTDWRFYRYIGIDFGIGSKTPSTNFNHYNFDYYRIHQTISKAVLPDFLIGVGYNLDIHNRISSIGKVNALNSDGLQVSQSTVSSGLVLNLLYDNRQNENFPVGKETFASVSLIQNLKLFNGTSRYESVLGDFRKYYSNQTFPSNVLAIRSFNWFTIGQKIPYFDLPAAMNDQYNSISRPFIEGRFRGKNLIYMEAEYRFNITKNEFFGGAFFLNSSSFSELTSNKFEKINTGAGASLRIKVNKKSKVYLVASYGIGSKGAKGFSFSLGDLY